MNWTVASKSKNWLFPPIPTTPPKLQLEYFRNIKKKLVSPNVISTLLLESLTCYSSSLILYTRVQASFTCGLVLYLPMCSVFSHPVEPLLPVPASVFLLSRVLHWPHELAEWAPKSLAVGFYVVVIHVIIEASLSVPKMTVWISRWSLWIFHSLLEPKVKLHHCMKVLFSVLKNDGSFMEIFLGIDISFVLILLWRYHQHLWHHTSPIILQYISPRRCQHLFNHSPIIIGVSMRHLSLWVINIRVSLEVPKTWKKINISRE